jgi:RNA polymerase sigma-70 factor, ECF subfamily
MAANSATFRIPQETTLTPDAQSVTAELESAVRVHARFVFKVAYGILRNVHDAEDVAQEVFLRVHRDGMRDVRDLQAWLATIAFRLAIDRKRRPEALDVAELELPASDISAERSAIERQQVERVHRLLASLPDDLRHPLLLSAIEELNSRQIAVILGIPESSVRGRIMRARQLLKEKLAAASQVMPSQPKPSEVKP